MPSTQGDAQARVFDLVRDAMALSHAHGSEREVIAARMARSLETITHSELLRLDAVGRRQLPHVEIGDVGVWLTELTEHAWAVAALFSFHANGYVREACVVALARQEDVVSLPFLLLRANDWVLPIRELAEKALLSRVTVAYVEGWLSLARLLQRAHQWRRSDLHDLLRAVNELLSSEAAAAARRTALVHPEAATRRLALRSSLSSREEDLEDLAVRISRSGDRSLRADFAKYAARHAACARLAEFFLLDVDARLRQWAQRSVAGKDHASCYRAELEAGQHVRTALFGLGETGTRTDTALALAYLEHPLTAVRRAALYALAWLDADGHAAYFVGALASDRRRVSQDAANWLCRFAHWIGPHRQKIQQLARHRDATLRERVARVLAAGREYEQRWGT